MKRQSLVPFGETEMEVLHHVWDLGSASVSDVRERMLKERDVAYTTVMTVMKNLADKGYLKYERQGKMYIYSPAQPAEEVRHSLIRDLVSKVFHGSPLSLVQTLVRHEDLSDDERAELKTMIDQMATEDDA